MPSATKTSTSIYKDARDTDEFEPIERDILKPIEPPNHYQTQNAESWVGHEDILDSFSCEQKHALLRRPFNRNPTSRQRSNLRTEFMRLIPFGKWVSIVFASKGRNFISMEECKESWSNHRGALGKLSSKDMFAILGESHHMSMQYKNNAYESQQSLQERFMHRVPYSPALLHALDKNSKNNGSYTGLVAERRSDESEGLLIETHKRKRSESIVVTQPKPKKSKNDDHRSIECAANPPQGQPLNSNPFDYIHRQIDEWKSQIDCLKFENDELKKQSGEKDKSITDQKCYIQDLEASNESKDTAIAAKDKEIASLKENNKALFEKEKILKEELRGREKKVRDLEAVVKGKDSDLKKKSTEYENATANYNGTQCALKQELKRKENELSLLEATIRYKDIQIHELEGQIVANQQEFRMKVERIKKGISIDCDQRKGRYIEKLKTEITELKAVNANRANELQEKIARHELRHSKLLHERDTEIKRLGEAFSRLESVLKDLRKRREEEDLLLGGVMLQY
jgi:hypothetical protein